MNKKQLKQKIKMLENSRLELQVSNKQKSEFIVNISHELKTPLNSIIGFSSLLSKNKAENLNEKQLKYLNSINNNGKNLSNKLTELIDLSKIEVGQLELDIKEIDLVSVINNIIQIIHAQVEEKAISLTFINELNLNQLFYDTDEEKIKQLFIHLLTNTIQFSLLGKGAIVIILSENKTHFMITIKDNRIETTQKELQQLLKKRKKTFALLVSKNICKFLDIDIKILKEENRGSLCNIYLPKKEQ